MKKIEKSGIIHIITYFHRSVNRIVDADFQMSFTFEGVGTVDFEIIRSERRTSQGHSVFCDTFPRRNHPTAQPKILTEVLYNGNS